MRYLKSLLVVILGVIAGVYLINPGAGIFEIIPDNIPFIGNLDEAAATVLLLNCLAYFGLDIRHLLGRSSPEKSTSSENRRPR